MLTVHHTLGPGFLESVYRRALLIELGIEGLNAESEKELTIRYNGVVVGLHRLDVLVEGCVIVELKAVEAIHRAHYDQLRSYLRAAGLRTGLLANFSGHKVDFRRVDMEIRRLPDDG